MLHYVHQLLFDYIYLLFGPGQVVYSGFIRVFSQRQGWWEC